MKLTSTTNMSYQSIGIIHSCQTATRDKQMLFLYSLCLCAKRSMDVNSMSIRDLGEYWDNGNLC